MIKVQRLNMDNSWLLEFDDQKLLIDPWLVGAEIDYFKWFNKQWHRHAPVPLEQLPVYDAIIITQKYPDHFHTETLSLLNPRLVFAPASIQQRMEKLLPETSVRSMSETNPHARIGQLNIHWFESTKILGPAFNAVAICNETETVLLATHGFDFNEAQLEHLNQLPGIELLFTPINEYKLPFFLGGAIAPGLGGLEKLIRTTGARRFVSSHDEDKHASGLVPVLAKIGKNTAERIKNIPYLSERYITVPDYEQLLIS